jgi:ABC-type multidrug transport system ATPase subunit
MINVVNVWHHYGIKPVLRDVSLKVEPGELVAVMGPNGMGKSTLLGLMGGVLWPIKGYVEIAGHRRRSSVEEEIEIRKKVVYLPDNPYLPLYSTGRESAGSRQALRRRGREVDGPHRAALKAVRLG